MGTVNRRPAVHQDTVRELAAGPARIGPANVAMSISILPFGDFALSAGACAWTCGTATANKTRTADFIVSVQPRS
jgi:hypothetical protein